MKKYLKKGLYFLIPLYLYILYIVIVDPYEFINLSHIVDSEVKIESMHRSDAVSPRGSMLWKLIHFNRNPNKNLIIGDSQSTRISESLVKELSGEEYYNFSVPGSSYKTIFQTFWHVTSKIKPESIYFQLGFMNYNANRPYNLFHFGQDYIDRPYLYFTTKEILYDCFINTSYAITGTKKNIQNSYEQHDLEYLNETSKRSLKIFFNDYKYPNSFQQELKRIAHYCDSNNIEITFVIMPVYKGVHEYITKMKLEKTNIEFKDFIKSLGSTFDFDTDSKLSEDRNNFTDYFHPKKEVVDDLTRIIWSNP